MEIVLAESLGFCMGVKRVVDMAYRALDKASGLPVVTFGPLIHNSQEIARLTTSGIAVADEAALPEKGTVIIRAHGIAPQAYEELKARGLKIMDGTCPYVHYSQRKAAELQREGYKVVIVGDRHHPEITGILGFINDDAIVVKSLEEVEALPQLDRIGVIAQTTISPKKYNAILDALRRRAVEVNVCETICDATEENQAAVRELSGEVDLLYVIGGRHSANSNKLVETARDKCPRSFLIETADEINSSDLSGVGRIGISAGASTPDWMIQRVIERLREIEKSLANHR
ncbi:MAG: 4-hydroxy-3-methylbut-2-enyl diphosphate reductase [Acidobacteriota bacterium]|nr:4-hydroxy-3-methylbut-2-enyl diphosphate reductase [Acidobacteriota bacterium]